jgi:hypothetical protein
MRRKTDSSLSSHCLRRQFTTSPEKEMIVDFFVCRGRCISKLSLLRAVA